MICLIKKLLKSLKNRLKQWNRSWREQGTPLLKLIFLHILREVYLFSRNILGLIFHPYKTLSAIRREKDISQTLILFSWPFPIWLALVIMVLIIKFFFHPRGILDILVNLLAISYTLFAIIYSFYILYWFLYYLKVQRELKNE